MGLFGLFGGGGGGPSIPNVARPADPTYKGLTGDDGQLQSQYSVRQQPRGEFEQRLRQQALQQGPTAQTMQQAGQAGQLAQQGYQQNISNAARSGGVSAGSRERLGKAAMLAGMQGRQQAFAQGEQQKLGLQQGFANQEGTERGIDVNTQIGNRQGENDFAQNRYRAQLGEFAAAQNARAQMAIGKQQQKSALFGALGSAAGMAGGFALGSPAGMMAGGALGGGLGSAMA